MISIVIPAYNAQRHIPRMLACLRVQTNADFEAVFVDDGSTDNTLSLLREAEACEAFVRVVSKENGGVSSARNAGLSAAKGDFVAFADADDLLAPNYVEILSKLSAENADAVRFAFTRVDEKAEDLPPALENPAQGVDSGAMLSEFLRDPKLFGPYGFVFRRDFLLENELRFAEGYAYYEDYDFLIRAVACAKTLKSCASILYAYRQAQGSAMMRYKAERIFCLNLADDAVDFLQKKSSPAAESFAKWYKARLYWAALWQACMALQNPADARKFIRLTDGARILPKLADHPSRKVAATALLARVCPEAFALLAKKLGGRKSLLKPLTADGQAALFAELVTPAKNLPI